MKKIFFSFMACAAVLALYYPVYSAAWKFGLISDTQWLNLSIGDSGGLAPNSVPVGIINQVNKEFIRAGVKFVIAVGDITDDGEPIAIDTRALYAQGLYNAGIGFYPLRGNHEDNGAAASEFVQDFPQTQNGVNNTLPQYQLTPQLYTDSATCHPVARTGDTFTLGWGFTSPVGANSMFAGLSYAFNYRNVTCMLLDQFTLADYSTNLPDIDMQEPWIDSVLSARPAGNFPFVFGHKGIITENHYDNLFGNFPSSDPAGTDTFINILARNGVHYYIGGHDHMHNRAIVRANGSATSIQNVILASDSYKFYVPSIPSNDTEYNVLIPGGCGFTRETEIVQQLKDLGYYIVTIDSPFVTIDYYGVPTNPTWTPAAQQITTTPVLTGKWNKMERFGYSLNGKEFKVPEGGSYTGVVDSFRGTIARILGGVNQSTNIDSSLRPFTQLVGTGWKPSTTSPLNDSASSVLTLWGMADTLGSMQTWSYALSLHYTRAVAKDTILHGKFGLVAQDSTGNWKNAVLLNMGSPLPLRTPVIGPWTSSQTLGAYGIDTAAHTVWAVINYTSNFAAADFQQPIPVRWLGKATQVSEDRITQEGDRLIMPIAFANKKVEIEFLSLSGRLLQRLITSEQSVNIADVKKKLGSSTLLVRCRCGKAVIVQNMIML